MPFPLKQHLAHQTTPIRTGIEYRTPILDFIVLAVTTWPTFSHAGRRWAKGEANTNCYLE